MREGHNAIVPAILDLRAIALQCGASEMMDPLGRLGETGILRGG
jgi:hypothetical protein